jgi:hypothetical protein
VALNLLSGDAVDEDGGLLLEGCPTLKQNCSGFNWLRIILTHQYNKLGVIG